MRFILLNLGLVFSLCACASKPARLASPPDSPPDSPLESPRPAAPTPVEAGPLEAAAEPVPVSQAPVEQPAPTRTPASYLEEAALQERADAYIEAITVYDDLFLAYPSFPGREEVARRRATLLAFVDLAERSYARALEAETLEEEILHLALIQSFWPGYEDVGKRLLAARAGTRLSRSAKAD